MRACLPSLLLAIALAGCKPETARPVPVDGQPRHSTISAGTDEEQPPPADAATDGETMSPEKARETVHRNAVEKVGVLEVLGADKEGDEAPNVLSPDKGFSKEEVEALQEALGTLEKKPPPPMKKP